MPTVASTSARPPKMLNNSIMKLRSASECASTWFMDRTAPVGTSGSAAASVSRRPHHDASRKPALEEAGCSQFRLRRRNKRRRFGRLIDVTLHVAHHADYLAQFTADVKVLSERTHTLQKTSRKCFVDDDDAAGAFRVGIGEEPALLQ